MPELPEVEIITRGLEKSLHDHPQLLKIDLKRADLREPIPKDELQKFIGQKIKSVSRRGKYILFNFANGTIISHLGMTGTWRESLDSQSAVSRTHDHLKLLFSDGLELIYNDPRRFGYFGTDSERKLKGLGPEPLTDDFNLEYLLTKSRRRDMPIKSFIMDAKVVVGVGNIYACESLFIAGIIPTKKAKRLSLAEIHKLVTAIKSVLTKAIKMGGSSINDYRQIDGQSGAFQKYFFVYDRAKAKCLKCGAPIRSKVISGRNTFWCPTCQR